MLLRPFSDIHTEFWQDNRLSVLSQIIPSMPLDKDTIAIVAGDTGLAHRPETWHEILELLGKQFLAVICIEGNHFYYKNDYLGRITELRKMFPLPENVHFLENESVAIGGILFVGATLWTDFDGNDIFKMQQARMSMNDFNLIRNPDGSLLHPEDTVQLFMESKRFIFDTLEKAAERKVVVTHHGISPLSIHEKYRGDSLNYAFMTDLSNEIIDHGPDIWVHGHTHNSFDYTLGKTRVIVNPYGYKDVEVNPEYDRKMLIELPDRVDS